jgi:hypothetical protein
LAFLKNIEAGEEIGTVFRHMTADVCKETQGKQIPELSLSYIGDFYLKDRPEPQLAAGHWNATADVTSPSAPNTQVAVAAPPSAPSANFCGGATMTVSLSWRAPCALSMAEERSLKPKDAFKECDRCPEMVVVPTGSFTMIIRCETFNWYRKLTFDASLAWS